MAVLPPKWRGPGPHPDRADRARHLQSPRAPPAPCSRRVASDGCVRRVQNGPALDRQSDSNRHREAINARGGRTATPRRRRVNPDVPPRGTNRARCASPRRALRDRSARARARRSRIRCHRVDPNEMAIHAAKERIPDSIADRLHFVSVPRDALPGLVAGTRFDAILCLDHALGRGPRSDDVAFLGRLATHVGPDGRLILDPLNRDFFASRPRPFAFHTIGSLEQHEFRSFEPATGVLRLEWKFYERVGQDLKHRTESSVELLLLTPQDLVAILRQSGWRMVGVWGGWQRQAVTADHRKLIVLATPAG